MIHRFFSSLARSRYLSITKSDRLAEMKWSVCISKSQRNLCISFARMNSGLFIHHLFIWSNLNYLHNSEWITLPIQPCLALYTLFALIDDIRLCDWSFCLYYHRVYICYFLGSSLFLLWNSYSSWGVFLCCYQKRFSFSLKVPLS